MDDDLTSIQADDVLNRPFKASDLKNRVAMAERILSLAGNLAMARDQLKITGVVRANDRLHESKCISAAIFSRDGACPSCVS